MAAIADNDQQDGYAASSGSASGAVPIDHAAIEGGALLPARNGLPYAGDMRLAVASEYARWVVEDEPYMAEAIFGDMAPAGSDGARHRR